VEHHTPSLHPTPQQNTTHPTTKHYNLQAKGLCIDTASKQQQQQGKASFYIQLTDCFDVKVCCC
jgi:hypothetical protein